MVLGVIGCLLVLVFILYKSDSSKIPETVVMTGNQDIETALGYYNWFDKDKGGNTAFGDIPENLVKELQTGIVKNGERVYFEFTTSNPPKRNNVYLIVPNEKEPLEFGMIEQPLDGNSFIVHGEGGQYIYVLTGYWDDSHHIDYAFKITITNNKHLFLNTNGQYCESLPNWERGLEYAV
ncbi:MAG: hypothetical protein NHB14_12305 [Desulfosporosinus sp.]|nr:hypothetical protein [Desulfosporosinus sp.]